MSRAFFLPQTTPNDLVMSKVVAVLTRRRRLVQLLLDSVDAAVCVDEVVDELARGVVLELRRRHARHGEERPHLHRQVVERVEPWGLRQIIFNIYILMTLSTNPPNIIQ